jgi:hypothetical protein
MGSEHARHFDFIEEPGKERIGLWLELNGNEAIFCRSTLSTCFLGTESGIRVLPKTQANLHSRALFEHLNILFLNE